MTSPQRTELAPPPLRILFVTNHLTLACGVAEFGRQNVAALRALGNRVDEWWPPLDRPSSASWPDLSPYDVVHVNYHPGPLGHLQPPSVENAGGFRGTNSAYLHEPWATWQFGNLAVAFEAEETFRPRHYLLPMPVPDYTSTAHSRHRPGSPYRMGLSSLRQAGVDWVQGALAENQQLADQLEFDHGQHKEGGWLPTEAEIDRLARCDFLIYWYPGANQGQSAGLTMGIAAQRPIVLNRNRMFESVAGYEDELYFAETITGGIQAVLRDLKHGIARVPRRLKRARGWAKVAAEMDVVWRRILWERAR